MATRRTFVKLSAAAGGALTLGLTPTLGASSPVRVEALEGVPKAKKALNILILGGTGFTGPHQVRYALARGHRLTLLNRGRQEVVWPAEVEELSADRNEAGAVAAALGGRSWDVCIDNPTTLPSWVRDAGQALQGKVKQ
jgi:2'-hydroxyisoflavone reductase